MNIIEKSCEMKKSEIFRMTKDASIKKVSENIGLNVEVDKWLVYSENNSKGEEVTVLSIMGKDGEVYATNSPTFRNQFYDIVEMLGEEMIDRIEIVSGTSKNGRDFVTCSYTGDK